MKPEVLSELLSRRGITALTLAKEIGVPKSIVYEWKTGKREPSAANLRRLSEYFGVSMASLMEQEEQSEEELILLLRQAKQLSPEDHAALVQSFKQSVDLYLRAKQGNHDQSGT